MKKSAGKTARAMALLLCVIMAVLPLAACGGSNPGESSKPGNPGKNEEPRPEFVYVPEYFPVENDLGLESIQRAVYHDGRVFFTASLRGEEITETDHLTGDTWTYYDYRQCILSCNIDGSDMQVLPDYQPIIEQSEDASYGTNSFLIDNEGNIWLCEFTYEYFYDLPEDFDPNTDNKWNYPSTMEENNYLRKLSSTGAEIERIDLSHLKANPEDYMYVNCAAIDAQGRIYLACDNFLHVLSSSGEKLFTLECDSWINNIQTLSDGTVGVMTNVEPDYRSVMLPVDAESQSFGESVDMPANAWGYIKGDEVYDFYYSYSSELFGYKISSGESVSLLNWIDCDIDNDQLSMTLPIDSETVVCASYDWEDESPHTEFVVLKKTPSTEVAEKTVLTFACVYMDYNMKREIIEFNKTNDLYRIHVKDYSQYNTSDDYTLGMTKLNTEIIAGNAPDIFYTSDLPMEVYGSKGLLENLWPYIDADEALGGRDALVLSLFNALSDSEGNLYQVVSSFNIRTLVGHPQVVGYEPGWTLSELLDAYRTMPAGAEIFSQGMVKEDVFRDCLFLNLGDLVDWETGKCYFDSQQFIDYLKFTDLFPEEFDWENFNYELDYEDEYVRLRDGRQMLANVYFSSLDSIFHYKALFNNEFTFIGYPTQEGNGASFSPSGGLAISSTCKHKDAAWSFVRTILTEEYQEDINYWNLSTNKKVLYDFLEEANTPHYETDPVTGVTYEVPIYEMWVEEGTLPVYALNEEQMQQVYDLIENTDTVNTYDEKLAEIIMEEARGYFSGMKSAEEVASLIQNRVSIYVSEQS
ncbi:MAG: extracellular solute-binding protein [Oscillospiraceae bacterium]|nr:extracellular solute-binding protein [Oscillospiraceae bacterium]